MNKFANKYRRLIYKKYIKQIISDLHKDVYAFMPTIKEDCPNCIWSHSLKKSSGTFQASFIAPITILGNLINPTPFTRGRCPVCFGEGILELERRVILKAVVHWNPKPRKRIKDTPAGRESSSLVEIKALRKDYDIIAKAIYFIVDGVRCERDFPLHIRGLGKQEEIVYAYLVATEVGSDIKK